MPEPLLVLSPLRDEIEPSIAALVASRRIPRLQKPAAAYGCSDGCAVLGWSGIGGQATQVALTSLAEEVRPSAILHLGIAGALQAGVRPGDVYLCERIYHDGGCLEPDAPLELVERVASRLQLWPGTSVSVEAPASTPAEKRELALEYRGAALVEMETYWAAQAAHQLGIPILCLRVVCDALEQRLPDLSPGLDPVGRPRPLAFLQQLIRHPQSLVALPAMARSFLRARQRLTLAVTSALRHGNSSAIGQRQEVRVSLG